ncbi:MAG TPA: hypothetical protein VGK74_13200 [Symbiobacteriaceae bacterium]|jgi:integrase
MTWSQNSEPDSPGKKGLIDMLPVRSANVELLAQKAAALPRDLFAPLTKREWEVVQAELPDLDAGHLVPAVNEKLLRAAGELTAESFFALPKAEQTTLMISAQLGRCRLHGQLVTQLLDAPILPSTLEAFERALSQYFYHLQIHGWKSSVTEGRLTNLRKMVLGNTVGTARRLVVMGFGYSDLTLESLRRAMLELHSRMDRIALTHIAKGLHLAGHPGFSRPVTYSTEDRVDSVWAPIEETPLKAKAVDFIHVLLRSTKEAQTTSNAAGTFTVGRRKPGYCTQSARTMASFLGWCHEQGVATWEDALRTNAFTGYLEARRNGTWIPRGGRSVLQEGTLRGHKDTLLRWLRWVNCSTEPDLDPFVHMPPAVTKGVKKYATPPARGLVIVLLHQLITNQSGLIDDTRHRDFYLRRACMLLALTGLRAHEVMLLDWDCLRSADNSGAPFRNKLDDGTVDEYWLLQVNKTKTNPLGVQVRVGRDVAELVTELQRATPRKNSISCPVDANEWGDDRAAFRLFPAEPEQLSCFSQHTLSDWMVRVQRSAVHAHEQEGEKIAFRSWLKPHDLRRVRVSTLKMLRVPERDIARALNHKSIQTQQEYLRNRDWIAGLFRDISDASPIAAMLEDDIDPYEAAADALLNGAVKQAAPSPAVSGLVDTLIRHIAEHPELRDLPSRTAARTTEAVPGPLAPLRGGLPLHLWSCTAPAFVKCRNNDLACGGCTHYDPEPGKQLEHELYLFRVYVYLHSCKAAEKDLPAPIRNQKLVRLKLEGTPGEPGLVDDVAAMVQHTFCAKYGYSPEQIAELQTRLQAKALAYWRKYGKVRPDPSSDETAAFLTTGLLPEQGVNQMD